MTIHGPDGILDSAAAPVINVVGGQDWTIKESEAVVEEIHSRISPDARII